MCVGKVAFLMWKSQFQILIAISLLVGIRLLTFILPWPHSLCGSHELWAVCLCLWISLFLNCLLYLINSTLFKNCSVQKTCLEMFTCNLLWFEVKCTNWRLGVNTCYMLLKELVYLTLYLFWFLFCVNNKFLQVNTRVRFFFFYKGILFSYESYGIS